MSETTANTRVSIIPVILPKLSVAIKPCNFGITCCDYHYQEQHMLGSKSPCKYGNSCKHLLKIFAKDGPKGGIDEERVKKHCVEFEHVAAPRTPRSEKSDGSSKSGNDSTGSDDDVNSVRARQFNDYKNRKDNKDNKDNKDHKGHREHKGNFKPKRCKNTIKADTPVKDAFGVEFTEWRCHKDAISGKPFCTDCIKDKPKCCKYNHVFPHKDGKFLKMTCPEPALPGKKNCKHHAALETN